VFHLLFGNYEFDSILIIFSKVNMEGSVFNATFCKNITEYDVASYGEAKRLSVCFHFKEKKIMKCNCCNKEFHDGELDNRIAVFTKAIRQNPTDGYAFFELGKAYYNNDDFEKSIECFSRVLELNPKNAEAFFERSRSHAERQNLDNAISDLTEALKLKPDFFDCYEFRAVVHSMRKDFDLALADYSEIIRLDKKNISAYNGRGYVYYQMREADLALDDFNEVICLDTDNSYEGYANRGLVYMGMGEFDLAIKDFETQLKLTPGNERALRYLMIANEKKPFDELPQNKGGQICIIGNYIGPEKLNEEADKAFEMIMDLLKNPPKGKIPNNFRLKFPSGGCLTISNLGNADESEAITNRQIESLRRIHGLNTASEYSQAGDLKDYNIQKDM
jgi:tetratricopeptide (TPR) repeat protein